MPGIVIVVFVVFVILILVGGYFGHLAAQKRRAELSALAAELGWSFSADSDYSFDSRYAEFDCFQSGNDRYAYNLLQGNLQVGEAAWPAVMGDYHYETESRDKDGNTTTHNHYFSFLVVHLPFANAPDLFIRHEGFFDKVKRALGFDDIDFESAEFSKRFYVKSNDKKFAYDVIHPAMMEFLLTGQPPAIDIRQGRCCLVDNTSDWPPEKFRVNVTFAKQFFERWPKYLTADLEK